MKMVNRNAQLNIRSSYARERVRELTEKTGMTAAEVVEDALRGYVAPGVVRPVGRLVERNGLLVMGDRGRPQISFEAAEAELEAARTRDPFDGS